MCDVNVRAIHIERPPTCACVPSHDRVLRGVVGLPEDARGVHRGEAVDQLTHRGRERLVREVLVGPHRVAALRRAGDHLQHRADRGDGLNVTSVCTSASAVVTVEHDDLGMVVVELRDERVDLRPAEAGGIEGPVRQPGSRCWSGKNSTRWSISACSTDAAKSSSVQHARSMPRTSALQHAADRRDLEVDGIRFLVVIGTSGSTRAQRSATPSGRGRVAAGRRAARR